MNEYDSNRIYDCQKKINYKKTENLEDCRLLCAQYMSYQRKSYGQSIP